MAKWAFCPKRFKIELTSPPQFETHAMQIGTHMHKIYSEPVKSFDREILLMQLENKKNYHAFERILDYGNKGMLIRGIPDDYRILQNPVTQKKYVSLIEVKTTGHADLWRNEEAAASLQLQIYLWLMRPILESYNYEIYKHHWLEIFGQNPKKLIRRVMVFEHEKMEKELCYIINSYLGLEKMWTPEFYVCKRCPKTTKENCSWYAMRTKND